MWIKKPYIDNFKITSPFGERVHPITKEKKMHNGIDIAMPEGTKLYAPTSGIVGVFSDPKGYGNYISLDAVTEQGTRVQFIFAHLQKALVNSGDKVIEFQEIALSGNTGASTGAHLHLGLKINGKFVNPVDYINFA